MEKKPRTQIQATIEQRYRLELPGGLVVIDCKKEEPIAGLRIWRGLVDQSHQIPKRLEVVIVTLAEPDRLACIGALMGFEIESEAVILASPEIINALGYLAEDVDEEKPAVVREQDLVWGFVNKRYDAMGNLATSEIDAAAASAKLYGVPIDTVDEAVAAFRKAGGNLSDLAAGVRTYEEIMGDEVVVQTVGEPDHTVRIPTASQLAETKLAETKALVLGMLEDWDAADFDQSIASVAAQLNLDEYLVRSWAAEKANADADVQSALEQGANDEDLDSSHGGREE